MGDTRPSPDTPEEWIWLRGFEAGVIRCRADRNQVIQELIEKALGSEANNYKAYDCYAAFISASVAEWLKDQLKGE